MKSHNWKLEEVDGGLVGMCAFWTCADCGGSGGGRFAWSHAERDETGLTYNNGKLRQAFVAGFGYAEVGLSDGLDCDAVKLAVAHGIELQAERDAAELERMQPVKLPLATQVNLAVEVTDCTIRFLLFDAPVASLGSYEAVDHEEALVLAKLVRDFGNYAVNAYQEDHKYDKMGDY